MKGGFWWLMLKTDGYEAAVQDGQTRRAMIIVHMTIDCSWVFFLCTGISPAQYSV